MATIANLAVSLTARIGNFEKGFKKAQKIAKNFSRDLTKHVKTVAGYASAITSVAGAALTYMVKQQMAAIDSTAKLADVMGLSTKELSGLQLGAEITGVQLGQLNTGITRLQKNIGDAGDGLAAPIRSLEKLGLTAENLKGLSTANQIKVIADKFNLLTNQIDKSNVLLNLFGRSGLAIGKLLETGSEGITRFQSEAEKIGFSFSRLDAAKVENANDALTRTAKVITGIARRIAIQLAPYIEVIANRFRAFAIETNIGGEVVVNSINQIIRVFSRLVDIFNLLKAGWNLFVGVVNESARLLIEPAKAMVTAWNRALEFLGVETDRNLEKFLGDLTKGFAKAADDSAKEMESAWSNFVNGSTGKMATEYFKGIQLEASKASAAVNAMNPPNFDNAGISADTGGKAASFRQVNLERIAINAFSSKGANKNPQITTTNQILKQILNKTGSGALIT